MRIAYIDPNSNYEGTFDYDELIKAIKQGDDTIHIYTSFEAFADAFNEGYVSDEGYIHEV